MFRVPLLDVDVIEVLPFEKNLCSLAREYHSACAWQKPQNT